MVQQIDGTKKDKLQRWKISIMIQKILMMFVDDDNGRWMIE
jgi:hypothetical protein